MLFATLKRTGTEFSEDNLSDWAAALTYYGLLALFPALIALVGLIGLVGDPASTTKTITQLVTKIGPGAAAQTFAGPIHTRRAVPGEDRGRRRMHCLRWVFAPFRRDSETDVPEGVL